MKKLATLFLSAGMVVASAMPASAVDVKVDGTYLYSFDTGSIGFTGGNIEKALQRLRLGMTMAASENLSGYIQFQILGGQFGTATSNAGDTTDIKTRQMYIDWTVPGTSAKVRMGRQLVGLPAEAFGTNSIMDAGWGCHDGIAFSTPVTDWLSVDGLWVRAGSDGGSDLDQNNTADLFALTAPMKFDGFSVTPYIAYASIDDGALTVEGVAGGGDGTLYIAPPDGNSANPKASILPHDSNVFWAGATATLSYFDPLTVKLSFAYGHQQYEGDGPLIGANNHPSYANPGWNVEDRKGWNIQLKASYDLPFATPVLGGWYASGDDSDSKAMRDGWMPSLAGRFVATQDFHDGAYGLGGGLCTYNIAGTWGIQLGLEKISFLKDLTHDFKVTYIQGTNDEYWIDAIKNNALFANGLDLSDMGAYAGPHSYMTTSDSIVEVSLSNTYQIYKNLEVNFEMAYIFNDFDEDLYTINGKKNFTEDDWRVALTFQYSF